MTPPPGLDSLPTELHLLILESLASPADLFSFMTISKEYYSTFLLNRIRILAHVICNAFGANLQHALGAFYASRLTQEAAWTRGNVKTLLDNYFNDRLELPTSLAGLSQLSHMLSIVQRFSLDYSVRSIKLLTGDADVNFPPWSRATDPVMLRDHPLTLSATEEIRLRRAFLQFEMYAHCFPAFTYGHPSISQQFPPQHQSDLFLSRLRRWEVEEMCCVHQYMYVLANVAVYKIEDEFVDEVLDVAKVHCSTQMPTDIDTYPISTELASVGLDIFEDPLRKFEDLTYYDDVDEFSLITNLGLAFMTDFLLGDTATRRVRFVKSTNVFNEFLNEAVIALNAEYTEGYPDAECRFDGAERWDRHNYGWSLMYDYGYNVRYNTSEDPPLHERDLGYVFWDAARLRNSKDAAAPFLTSSFPRPGRTAEERLEDVYLPLPLFEAVAKRYTS